MKHSLKVLVVNRMLGKMTGGGEVFDTTIARYLRQNGHDVGILTIKGVAANLRHLENHDIPVYTIRVPQWISLENRLRHYSAWGAAILRYLNVFCFEKKVLTWIHRRHKGQDTPYDVVYGGSMVWLPFWLLRSKTSAVVTWLPGPPSRLQTRLLGACISNPRFGIFTHGAPVEILASQLGWKPDVDFQIIPPGVDIRRADTYMAQRHTYRQQLLQESEQRTQKTVGITVARLVQVKNHRLLLRGIQHAIRNLGAELHWVMVGDGPEMEQLRKYGAELGIEKNVSWCGHVPHNSIHRYYAASDFFALTSVYENFSLAAVEAMSHALPVIGTRVGFLERLVTESGGGILVSPHDASELGDAISSLALDSNLRRTLGYKARAFAEQLSWDRVGAQVLRLLAQTALVDTSLDTEQPQ